MDSRDELLTELMFAAIELDRATEAIRRGDDVSPHLSQAREHLVHVEFDIIPYDFWDMCTPVFASAEETIGRVLNEVHWAACHLMAEDSYGARRNLCMSLRLLDLLD